MGQSRRMALASAAAAGRGRTVDSVHARTGVPAVACASTTDTTAHDACVCTALGATTAPSAAVRRSAPVTGTACCCPQAMATKPLPCAVVTTDGGDRTAPRKAVHSVSTEPALATHAFATKAGASRTARREPARTHARPRTTGCARTVSAAARRDGPGTTAPFRRPNAPTCAQGEASARPKAAPVWLRLEALTAGCRARRTAQAMVCALTACAPV